MKILKIENDCENKGEGLRTVIHIAGCWHFCTGCVETPSWNKDHGKEMSIDEIIYEIELADRDVTIAGGDPLSFQYEDTLKLVKAIKERTTKNIWLYTGFKIEEVEHGRHLILDYIDVLVDGKFNINKQDSNLKYRRSSNQRILNLETYRKYEHVMDKCLMYQ